MSAKIMQGIVKDDGTIIQGYSEIEQPWQYGSDGSCNDNFFRVWEGDKCGILDEDGNEICPCKYKAIKRTKTDSKVLYRAQIQAEDNTSAFVFLNEQGEELPCGSFDEASVFSDSGLAVVKRDGKIGLVNSNGSFILQCEYDYIDGVKASSTLVRYNKLELFKSFCMERNGKWGAFNEHGVVVEAIYDDVYQNEDFYCTKLDGKYGIILFDGTIVCEPKYDEFKGGPYHGLYKVSFYKVIKSGFVGLISAETGEEILPCDCYSDIVIHDGSYVDLERGLYRVQKKTSAGLKLWGILRLEDFKEIIPCKYNSIISYGNGLGCVELVSGAIWYVTSDGTEVESDMPFVKGASQRYIDENGKARVALWDESKKAIIYCNMDKDGFTHDEDVETVFC